jgi:hypothetical protein
MSYPVYSGYPVYAPSEPTTYIEAAPAAEAASAANYYYCADPAGYYPYIQNCSKPWMQVVPQNVPSVPAPQ